MSYQRPGEMALGYEALRAVASSQPCAGSPAGLAVVLAGGLPSWMRAWEPLGRSIAAPFRVESALHGIPLGLGGDVVQLLTEMAFACTRRLAPL
jgi:hypothetical protein